MRRRFAVFTVAAMIVAIAGVARAMTFDPARSRIQVAFVGDPSPPLTAATAGGGGSVSLVNDGMGGHKLVFEASIWATVNYMFGSSLHTGVPLYDTIGFTLANNSLTATSSFTAVNYLSGWGGAHQTVGPHLGGQAGLSGNLFMLVAGVRAVSFPLTPVGGPPGGTFNTTVLGIPFTNTYMPWFAGPVPITGITTNVVSWNGVTGAAMTMRLRRDQVPKVLSTGGGFVTTNGGLPLEYHTVTPSGPNSLLSAVSTISGTASVTLLTPIRINTSPAVKGRVPGAVWMDLVFVPEPGSLLVLVTGAVGLAAIGRRRGRARR